jgi:hypothetical protein
MLSTACSSSASPDGIDGSGDGDGSAEPNPSGGGKNPGTSPASCAVEARGIAVSSGKGTGPAIVWGGSQYAVTWTSLDKDGGDIYFALLDDKGHKVREVPVDVGPDTSGVSSVVRTDSGYLVLWQVQKSTGSAILGRFLGEDGTPTDATLPLAQSQSNEARPAGVVRGSAVVAAWMDTPASFVGLLNGNAVGQPRPIDQGGYPALASAGNSLGLLWTAGSKLGFSRLSLPLSSLEPVMFRDAAGKANVPRIAAHEDGSFDIAWEDGRSGEGNENVYFTRIDADGKVAAELAVPPESGSANCPDVAWLGARSAVVYYQFRDGPPAIFLSLISPDLTRDGEEFQISGTEAARFPRLSWTGETLGVVYADNDGPVRLSLVTCQ